MIRLTEILQDTDGTYSFVRILGCIIVLAVVGKNLILSVSTGTNLPFTNDDLLLIGIVFGSKVAQKPFEKPAPPVLTDSVNEPKKGS
jgi:hypothetical protein